MNDCIEALKNLRKFAESEPAWRQAAENLRRDIASKNNPHGNIGPERAEKLAAGGADGGRSIPDVVAEYQTVRSPNLATPVKKPDVPMRQAMSLTRFVTYHALSSEGADVSASVEATKAELLENIAKANNRPLEYEIDDLQGSTGAPDRPSWWTFRKNEDPSVTANSERYLHELALSGIEIAKAKEDKMAIEVGVPWEMFAESLYKPCALDGFEENTLFRPDLTDAPCGRTAPADPKLTGQPELISRSFLYRDLPDYGMDEYKILLTPLPLDDTP